MDTMLVTSVTPVKNQRNDSHTHSSDKKDERTLFSAVMNRLASEHAIQAHQDGFDEAERERRRQNQPKPATREGAPHIIRPLVDEQEKEGVRMLFLRHVRV